MVGLVVHISTHANTHTHTHTHITPNHKRTATAKDSNDLHPLPKTGTDILSGDPLGRFDVSSDGVQKRDHMVWTYALQVAHAPIVMTLSGGEGLVCFGSGR
jgi:hypothetical protein